MSAQSCTYPTVQSKYVYLWDGLQWIKHGLVKLNINDPIWEPYVLLMNMHVHTTHFIQTLRNQIKTIQDIPPNPE